ncbi:hypothetical protein ALI144C_03800 [Actinosynnema sp. ALI-1.44]|uniref:hypothetical protein n=1 Tax=Actinosynnema sp. ALI-1.44 TaxID=1933779 RepID=UPI00097C7EB7|nr:hypothetical protein [Actinosynnema sp. ALI-1.44]ONI89830.1 hypothetical protein ALI144C_03800 [Actinosynnema sp. ALI-1.44]
MAQRLNAAARDAAASRVTLITTGVVSLSLAGTIGLGYGIADMVKAEKAKAQQAAEAPDPQQDTGSQQGTVPQGQVPPKQTGQPSYPGTQGKQTPKPKPKPTTKPPVTSSGGS